MLDYLLLAAAGAAGQLVRATYGIADAMNKGESIDKKRFITTLLGGVFLGAAGGVLLGGDLKGAFLSGFAGVDVIEGVTKLRK